MTLKLKPFKLQQLLLVVSLVIAALAIASMGTSRVSALSGSEFEPGYIIDDAVFYDRSTMSPDQIQAFLNAKVPVCDTNGTQPYGGTTRAAYGASKGYPAPYTCLKDYTQAIPTVTNSGSDLCTGSISAGTKSAAQIIHEVGYACGINPQVLIVLLQKEQSLVTDDWPWSIQYRSATGYGCPDTAPCDSEYYGFFNQVYQAAKAFKRYAANPGGYNYRYGRNNTILWHPNAGCGTSNVYIQNQATASLYIYTPYRPNQAALDNLYTTGDGCSSYGNRNFWRMFNDWFGSTRGSYLLRSVSNATVYMVVDDMKYPIADMNTLGALYPLGSVKFVSDDYLNQKTTGNMVGRLLRSENGTIYFYDAGIKLAFTSCAMLEHYGFGAGCDVSYASLTDPMLQKFVTGPNMTRVFGTTSGKQFYIENGKKREIFDDTAKQQAGITAGANTLNESAISALSYGVPVLRQNVVVKVRETSDHFIYQQSIANPLPSSLISETALSTKLTRKSLDKKGVDLVSKGQDFNGLLKNNSSTQYFIIDGTGKLPVGEPEAWPNSFMTVSDTLLSVLPNSTQPIDNRMVKSPSNGTVFYIAEGKKKPIYDWGDFLRMGPDPAIVNTLSSATLSSIPTGSRLLGPTRLVKSPDNATIYMINGTTSKYPVSSFDVTETLGIGIGFSVVAGSVLDEYEAEASVLVPRVTCDGKNYIASYGYLYEVQGSMQEHYQLSYLSPSSETCGNLKKSNKHLDRFLLSENGTIYYVDEGQKRPITGFEKYLELGGNNTNTRRVSNPAISQIPTGPVAN